MEKTRVIACIGRNFAAHAKELNNPLPDPKAKPFFFLKPTSSILQENKGNIMIPKGIKAHYEVELALIINQKLSNTCPKAKPEEYLSWISGYRVAIDITARDLQEQAKKEGKPWTQAKGYDTFLPISEFLPKAKIPDPHNVDLYLSINGKIRQTGNTKDMIFNIPQCIAAITEVITLNENDVVLLGTPPGVGEIKDGDEVVAGIKSVHEMKFLAQSRSY